MENNKLGQEPAFGFSYETKDFSKSYKPESVPHKFDGISKREYIATMAMQGLLSSVPTNKLDLILYVEMKERVYGNISVNEAIAKEAVTIADALLKELNAE